METKRKLKTGVIGLGQCAQIAWLPYLHELDEYDVVAYADTSRQLLDYFGDLYNVPLRYTDWKALLQCPEVEAVVILNSNHTEVCIKAAKAKKQILVEKPLCENPQQAAQIQKAVEENGVTLMVGEMKRYDAGYRYAAGLIKQMKGLRMIRIRDICDGLEASQPEIYQSKRRQDVPAAEKETENERFMSGLQAVTGSLPARLFYRLLLAGVHDIDIMRAAFGEPLGVHYCDIWDDGNMLVAELDYGDQVKAMVEIGYTNQKWFEEELVAYGLDQTIRVRFPHPYLMNCPTRVEIIQNEDGMIAEKNIEVAYTEAFRNELLHFYDCVTQGKKPETDVGEGRRDLELLSEIFRCYADRVESAGG